MDPRDVANRVAAAGGRCFMVGGAVRDKFMGRDSKDIDLVVTGLSPTQVSRALDDAPMVGRSFPVFKIGDVDVALARTERKTGDRHHDFECVTDGVTIEDDLARRDLTMNAIAIDMRSG